MLRRLHANATTTPKTRAYIQASTAFVQSSRASVDQAEMTRDYLQIARLTYERLFGAPLPITGLTTIADVYLKQFASAP